MVYEAVVSSWAYYYSVDEFVEGRFNEVSARFHGDKPAPAKAGGEGPVIRLAGRVKEGSISYNVEEAELEFELAGQKNSISVRFCGLVPKNFASGKEVVVEGRAGPKRVFLADKILTRCESKYKVKLNETELMSE